jgi:hypothetical protein
MAGEKLMPINSLVYAVAISAAFFLTACATENCSNVPQRPLASETAAPSPAPVADQTVPATAPVAAVAAEPTQTTPPRGETVQVFKSTGQLQCGQDPGLPLDEVRLQLSSKKISVYEAHTQPDGRMHMALCGAPSGTIHVFTISKKSLKKAEKIGFKILGSH